jgi:predicted nucleotidyltransferase
VRRRDLEHVIRAAAAIAGERELVIIGTSSLLGAVPDAPASLARSRDVDLFPLNKPELADLIDGAIGEASAFEEQFGYYAHGVGPRTATLPRGWKSRLVKVQNPNTNDYAGLCLEPHDLAASKLVAFRDKDKEFVKGLLRFRIVRRRVLLERIADLPVAEDHKKIVTSWIEGIAKTPAKEPRGRRRGR